MEKKDNSDVTTKPSPKEQTKTSEAIRIVTSSLSACSGQKLSSPRCLSTNVKRGTKLHSNLEESRRPAIRMQSLEEDNNRLRERVAHVENLGVLFADAEEDKLNLIEENLALRKKLDHLEKILMEKRLRARLSDPICTTPSPSSRPLLESHQESLQFAPTFDDECPTMVKVRPETKLQSQKSDHHIASDDDVIRFASLFLSHAAGVSPTSLNQEMHTHEKTTKETNPSSEINTGQDKRKTITSSESKVPNTTSNIETNYSHEKISVSNEDKNAQKNLNDITQPIKVSSNFSEKTNTCETKSFSTSSNKSRSPYLNKENERTLIEHSKQANDCAMKEYHKLESDKPDYSKGAEEKFNQEIQQLEDMIQRESSGERVASLNETSMTFQFTKIAGVFASLAQRVVKSQKQAKNSQVFCDDLIAENKNLKSQVIRYKQQLEETRNCIPSRATTAAGTQTLGETPKMDQDQQLVAKLQARVKKLEKQREEILRVNKNWDTQYKKLRDELERRTANSPLGGTPALAELPGSSKESPRKTDVEKSSNSSHHQASKQIQSLKHEVVRLKQTIAELDSERGCLKAENARLNQALEATYSVYERRSSMPRHDKNDPPLSPYSDKETLPSESSVVDELRTHIEVLQEQVKIYREDFETERRDRERSQSEKQKMQEALARSRREVQTLTQQIRSHEATSQRERRDKEKAQRQLRLCQRNHPREANGSRRRDRYYGETNDLPAYQATHRRMEAANPNYSPTSNKRRNKQPQLLYEATANDLWFEEESPDEEVLPQSPGPEDELDPIY